MSTNAYIQKVNDYADFLVGNEEALTKLVELFNIKGEEYFGSHRSGYIAADPETVIEGYTKKIYNKAEFFQKLKQDQGWSDDEVSSFTEAAFDDSFRHTIFLDVSDMENPKLVDAPEGTLRDSVLRWDTVETLPIVFPGGNTIAVHLDMMEQIFFPIPTGTKGGKHKNKKTRKQSSHSGKSKKKSKQSSRSGKTRKTRRV
jgi:hypothetical protein